MLDGKHNGCSTRGNAAKQTRLGIFCDKVIEAGWLAAAIVIPLYSNYYSYTAFEPNKFILLRSIVLVMASAYLVKALDAGGGSQVSGLQHLVSTNPLALPILLLTLVLVLSTLGSLSPRLSFWGSYIRGQGIYSTLSCILIFFLMWHSLRTRQQLERLITVILLTSLPVCLYGILQHYNLDHLPWAAGGGPVRVQSTIGNPIFLAAYLVMVIPVTLGRLAECFSGGKGRGSGSYTLVGCYGLLLAFQTLCILFTQSRGPFLGLLGGIFFFLLLLAVTQRRKGLALGAIAAAAVTALFLVVLNLPNTPLATLKDAPYLGRLGRILETESGTVRVRILIWEGVIEMATASPWRTVLGYWPEAMQMGYISITRPSSFALSRATSPIVPTTRLSMPWPQLV